jgi:hypothetical protein
LSRDSSSTTSPRVGSSSTTSPTPRVWVPRHVARLVTRLVVNYFAYAARPGASARRVDHHAARRRLLRLAEACRRLLHIRRASDCFGMLRGLSRDSSSTTLPRTGSSSTTSPPLRVRVPRHVARLVIDYFASRRLVADYFSSHRLVVHYFTYTARPVASARRVACRVTHRRLLHLA